jgi:hypothetical protein
MKSKITYCDKEIIIDETNKTVCLEYSQIAYFSTYKPYVQITILYSVIN